MGIHIHPGVLKTVNMNGIVICIAKNFIWTILKVI